MNNYRIDPSMFVAKTSSESFAAIEDIPNPQITETAFINEFLKLMLDPNLPEDVMIAHNARWLHYAGNPFMPLDVVRNGTVIYTVPALFDNDAKTLNEQGVNGGFRLLIRTVDDQNKVASHFGNQVLNAYIANYVNRDREINPVIAASWRHIFDFYGIAEEVIRVHTGKEVTANPSHAINKAAVNVPNYGDDVDLDEDC